MPTCSATCSWNELRSGQPATVSAIVTWTSGPVDLDVAHHVELGDRLAQLGVDDLLERRQDLVAVDHRVERSAVTPSPAGARS